MKKIKKNSRRTAGQRRVGKTMTHFLRHSAAAKCGMCFYCIAAATAGNLARLSKGYRTKWHSPQRKLLADNIKKRLVQRYANKIISEERAVIFLRVAAVGFFNCSYWRNDNCCNCLAWLSVCGYFGTNWATDQKLFLSK